MSVPLRIPAKRGGYAIAEKDQEILMAKSTDRVILAVTAIASLAFTGGCAKQPTLEPARLQRFAALPEASTYSASDPMAAKIELGRMLYFDDRLSKSQTVSCNSCHPLSTYGADGKPVSVGHAGQRGTRNSPTVYNAAMQFAQFWDGRAPDVEVQAAGPLLNPGEMATSKKAVVKVVKSIPGYVAAFREAYPADRNPVTFEHVVDSIGKFERGLVTPSRWDRFLAGDQSVLSSAEKAGLSQFLNAGCDGCHSGVLVGGAAFQKLGAVKEYTDTSDSGRYLITRNQSDRMVFKVPSLRNVARTGPYFHHGRVSSLAEAVAQMAEFQTGRQLSAADRDAIVMWLSCLTGEIDPNYVRRPDLPKGSAKL